MISLLLSVLEGMILSLFPPPRIFLEKAALLRVIAFHCGCLQAVTSDMRNESPILLPLAGQLRRAACQRTQPTA